MTISPNVSSENQSINDDFQPKIRFKEFNESWKDVKLSEISSFSKGKGISKMDISETGYPCVRYGELYTKYNELINEIYSKTEINKSNLIFSEFNDILIPCSGETAIDLATASCIPKENVAIGGDITIIKTNQYAPFITYYLNYKKNEVAKYAQGVSIVHLYSKDLKNISLKIPNIDEQKKIISFITCLDKKISLMQKKHKNVEKYKKSVLENIMTNKISFLETSEWKQTTLKNILKERKELSYNDGRYPHVTLSKEGISPKTEQYNREFLVKDENKKYKITHYNDICYNPANLKFGVICLNKFGSAIFSPIYVTFEVKNADTEFISYYLTRNNFINKIRKYEEGTVYERMAVKPSDFLKGEIYIPSLEDQKRISNFLNNIDKKIEENLFEINKLKEFKKGLLQKMFV